MIKKNMWLVLTCILALTLMGCGSKDKVKEINNNVETVEEKSDNQVNEEGEDSDTVVENTDNDETKTTTEEKTTNNTEETIQTPSTETTTGKNESTTTTQKPAANNNTTSNNTSNNANNTTPNTNDNTNNNNSTTPKPTQPVHEHTWVEVTEEVKHYYAWRTICNVCGTDLTDMEVPDKTYHVGKICGGSYAAYYKEVDFVTENVQTETIVTGYKCSCGEVKEN